jgi:hypothetical protein
MTVELASMLGIGGGMVVLWILLSVCKVWDRPRKEE